MLARTKKPSLNPFFTLKIIQPDLNPVNILLWLLLSKILLSLCQDILPIPGWCSSVDWTLACEPKGRQFDSQSGHMPGLWVRSLVEGGRKATTDWCFSPLLSPSLPFCLKINKQNLKKKIHPHYNESNTHRFVWSVEMGGFLLLFGGVNIHHPHSLMKRFAQTHMAIMNCFLEEPTVKCSCDWLWSYILSTGVYFRHKC